MSLTVVKQSASTNSITVEQIDKHCRSQLSGFKVPRLIIIKEHTDPLPKSGAGKILKTVLREPFWEDSEMKHVFNKDDSKKTGYS